MTKKEILDVYHKHSFAKFSEHNELLAMVVCSEYFTDKDYHDEFNEIIFAVEKQWLVDYLNEKHNWYEWDGEKVKEWLRSEYMSDDSYTIFCDAMTDNAIVMLEFN